MSREHVEVWTEDGEHFSVKTDIDSFRFQEGCLVLGYTDPLSGNLVTRTWPMSRVLNTRAEELS